MKNDLQFVPANNQTTAEFLLLVNRTTYGVRFITSSAIHVADAGEWDIAVKGEAVVISFSRGRILDSQNRAWIRGVSLIRPVNIVVPYGYPVFLSSLGVRPRYFLRFPHACSLLLESSVSIDSR